MNYMTVLNHTVTANLASGRIGVPVFVRWTASAAESKEVLKAQLAEMTTYTNRWLATEVRRLYATGTEAQGHLCLALEYTTGGSALLALTLAHNRPHVNLAIYGDRGAIYHNDFIVPIRDGSIKFPPAGKQRENTSDQDAPVLLDAIERSLAAHQPIELNQSGGPA